MIFRLEARWISTVALGLFVAGCHSSRKGPEPLSYEGATTIARYLLPELISGYEESTGGRFGAVHATSSAAAFKAVMEGRVGLAGVARPLKATERVVEPYYAILAYDALGIFVNAENPVQSLTRAQLKEIFTGKVTGWQSLGGPDAPIELVFEQHDQGRGTTDVFREQILEALPFARGTTCEAPPDCVALVARRPNAVTIASVTHAIPGTKVIAVDGILPTPHAVRAAEYPLSRPLLLVTKAAPRGEAKAFFTYALSPAGQARVAHHFVPAREVP